MALTLQQLYYAIVIAEAGSLNKASERLYVAQPTLTGVLQDLERETGITIFNRSGRGVTLTNDGAEFIVYAQKVYDQYESLQAKYGKQRQVRKKFGISAQHYSFAVKAFVEMAKKYDSAEYDFAVRETKTSEVISDVATMKSEIGIIFLSEFNAGFMNKLLKSNGLSFNRLIRCQAYVYLWKEHPLASRESISFAELEPYPCLTFEQGDAGSFYYSEEILTTVEYPRIIKTTDRATMLNLMVGLNGYILCSGIICEELNGSDYVAVPFRPDEGHPNSIIEIGYITRKNTILSDQGQVYIQEVREYLSRCENALREETDA